MIVKTSLSYSLSHYDPHWTWISIWVLTASLFGPLIILGENPHTLEYLLCMTMALQLFQNYYFLALCFGTNYSIRLFASPYFCYLCWWICFILVFYLFWYLICAYREISSTCVFCIHLSMFVLPRGSLLSHQYSLRYRANMWSKCRVGLNVPVICYLKKKEKSSQMT